jgi:phosphoglycolate phosphatase
VPSDGFRVRAKQYPCDNPAVRHRVSAVRTILFDLDGTLVDSAPLITHHLAGALRAVGATVPGPAGLLSLVGPPFETALPAIGLTAEQTTAAIAHYRGTYDAVAAEQSLLFPGIPALLEKLDAAGLRLAVATAKPEDTARRIVAGVGIAERFVLVGGSNPTVGRVGKGPVIASVLARLSIDPAHAPVVMVGDRSHDVEGATANGVPAIGVGWGYADPGELTGARLVVPDLDALFVALTENHAALWSA